MHSIVCPSLVILARQVYRQIKYIYINVNKGQEITKISVTHSYLRVTYKTCAQNSVTQIRFTTSVKL